MEADSAIPPPCLSTIATILKHVFHLHYKKLNTANFKYRDPTYNEKRLWVSRMLAHFVLEDYVVISIDETNFRNDSTHQRQWEFNPIVKGHKEFTTEQLQSIGAKTYLEDLQNEDMHSEHKSEDEFEEHARVSMSKQESKSIPIAPKRATTAIIESIPRVEDSQRSHSIEVRGPMKQSMKKTLSNRQVSESVSIEINVQIGTTLQELP